VLIILPNYISDLIDQKVEEAIAKVPEAAPDRELFRQELINHFAEHGNVPDFTLAKKEKP
jgi:hypothetical protein